VSEACEMPDGQVLVELARARMPFGKYAGRRLMDLPEAYLVWFARKGFPPGKLGEQLRWMHELREAGVAHLLRPLRDG
jgi:uncharacterized protein (DUF3820 family)